MKDPFRKSSNFKTMSFLMMVVKVQKVRMNLKIILITWVILDHDDEKITKNPNDHPDDRGSSTVI